MSGRRLYIGRVPADATRKDLESYFGAAGGIVDVRLMAGFAFLEFEDLKDAEQAVDDFNGKDFMGERLIVEFAKPPRNMEDRPPRRYDDDRRGGYGAPDRGYGASRGFDRGPPMGGPRGGGGHRLVVNGVPSGCSWQDLKDFARGAGTVTFADVDRNNPTIGYIEYPSRADADDAIRTLSNTDLKGVPVTVEEADGGRAPDNGYGRRDDRRSDRYDDRRDDRRSDRYDDRRDSYRRDDRDREYRSERRPRSVSPPPRRRDDDRDRRRSPPPPPPDRERERSPVRERGDW